MKSKKKLLNLFVFLHCQSLCLKAKKNPSDKTYVLTLPFWTGGSCFERTAPILLFLPEISLFEMVLAWMPDIYEFFKSITFFANSVWKLWLVVTKLGAFIALATIFIMNSRSMPTKGLIVLALAKEALGTSLRINTVCNF